MDILPAEILQEIESYLQEAKDFLAWRSTCRRLRALASFETCEKRLVDPVLAESVRARNFTTLLHGGEAALRRPRGDFRRLDGVEIPRLAPLVRAIDAPLHVRASEVRATGFQLDPAPMPELLRQRGNVIVVVRGRRQRAAGSVLLGDLVDLASTHFAYDCVFHGHAGTYAPGLDQWIPPSYRHDLRPAARADNVLSLLDHFGSRPSSWVHPGPRRRQQPFLAVLEDVGEYGGGSGRVPPRGWEDCLLRMLGGRCFGTLLMTTESVRDITPLDLNPWMSNLYVIVPRGLSCDDFIKTVGRGMAFQPYEVEFRLAWAECDRHDDACLVLVFDQPIEMYWYRLRGSCGIPMSLQPPTAQPSHVAWLLHRWYFGVAPPPPTTSTEEFRDGGGSSTCAEIVRIG